MNGGENLTNQVETRIRLLNSQFGGLNVYEILEEAKEAKGRTSGINFVSLDRLRIYPHQVLREFLMLFPFFPK
jgi:hypothetical protein